MSVAEFVRQRPGYGPPAPVEVFQWEPEFTELLELYRERKPKRVLEIGTYHGGTLYHWLQNAEPGATVVSLDSYRAGVDNRSRYPEWCPADVSVVALEGDSTSKATAGKVRKYGPYDWVWIDGGHYYHEVRADWKLYGSMCKPGGVVSFHDILPPTRAHPRIEVARLWAEIVATHETTEIVANTQADWGGIGIVFA